MTLSLSHSCWFNRWRSSVVILITFSPLKKGYKKSLKRKREEKKKKKKFKQSLLQQDALGKDSLASWILCNRTLWGRIFGLVVHFGLFSQPWRHPHPGTKIGVIFVIIYLRRTCTRGPASAPPLPANHGGKFDITQSKIFFVIRQFGRAGRDPIKQPFKGFQMQGRGRDTSTNPGKGWRTPCYHLHSSQQISPVRASWDGWKADCRIWGHQRRAQSLILISPLQKNKQRFEWSKVKQRKNRTISRSLAS